MLRQAYERDTTDAEIVDVFNASLEAMRRAAAVIVDPAAVPLDGIRRAQGAGPCGGFKYDINRYLAGHGDRIPVKSLSSRPSIVGSPRRRRGCRVAGNERAD